MRADTSRPSTRLAAELRAAAAVSFLLRLVFMLLFIAGGVWALLTYLEPCEAATLCAGLPLIRQPYFGRGPLWWQRLVLKVRLLRLGARQRTAALDVQLLARDLAVHRAMLDTAETDMEAEYLRDEIALMSQLHSACLQDRAEAEDQIDWARSDLAKLS